MLLFSFLPERCQKIFSSSKFSSEAVKIIEEITNYPLKCLAKLENSIPPSIKQFCVQVAGEEEAISTAHKIGSFFQDTEHQLIIFCQVKFLFVQIKLIFPFLIQIYVQYYRTIKKLEWWPKTVVHFCT